MIKLIRENKIMILMIIVLGIITTDAFISYARYWDDLTSSYAILNELHPGLNYDTTKIDVYNAFVDIITNSKLNMLQLILPIIVIIPSLYNFFLLLKSGFFKDILLRKSYNKFMFKEILKSYISSFIIPIILIFLFSLVSIHFKNFDINYTYNNILGSAMMISEKYLEIPGLFIMCYIFNLWLISIFFINVGLIFINKNKNFILMVLFSFLSIMTFQIIFEVFLGMFLSNLFNNYLFLNLFSIYNLWVYSNTDLLGVTIYVISLVIISSIMVYLTFKNKEKVVIENEK